MTVGKHLTKMTFKRNLIIILVLTLFISPCMSQTEMINLIGLYKVPDHENVHLFEFKINSTDSDFDVGDFTQKLPNVDSMNWQVPYEEQFLDQNGTRIIGDYRTDLSELEKPFRLVFFFHYFDLDKPLNTPFGDINIKKVDSIPKRLSEIIEYEEPY